METKSEFERGAEWRQWDLHVHTPASFHWLGKRFEPDPNSVENAALVDEMIAALNAAQPAVFALMDYWTFDGWFALKRRLAQEGAPKLLKRVFPGIELRLMAPMTGRLNAHVLFSDEISDQMLRDFQAALNVELVNRPLSNDSLVALARMVGEDKLKLHGFKKTEVDTNIDEALRAGSVIAEINCDSYKSAIERVPNGYAVGFMPFDTSDGLAEVKWQEHYAYCLGLFKSSPIFETRDLDTRGAFVDELTPGNEKWIDNFQKALGGIPRLAVAGSDAHVFTGVLGDNNRRGYGDFPSGKATWIKADPTFLGLLQAIKEPAKRSYIGERPEKLREVEENKTFFINSIEISKATGSLIPEEWLAGCRVLLNHDLVAIIGNKGSGKSALADVIALLGNSRQKEHFSFLKKDRFRGKSGSGDPAKQFVGKIEWLDKSSEERRLSDDPPGDKVQLVRYIPQGHFEDLCNDHIAGRVGAFEKELRAVIFDYAGGAIRLGALDFDQLIEQQESGYRDQLGEYRKDLARLNLEIENIEAQRQPQVKRSLQELLALKKRQIEEHGSINNKPVPIPKPSEQLSSEQQQAASSLDEITVKLKGFEEEAVANASAQESLAAKLKSIQAVRERLRTLEKQYKQFQDDTAKDLQVLGVKQHELATLSVNQLILDEVVAKIPQEQQSLVEKSSQNELAKQALHNEQSALKAKLNEPQLLYQKNLKAIELWEEKLRELTGAPDAPETLKGIENRIAQLDELPVLLESKQEQRRNLAGDIFDILDAQRKAREDLFKPVQDLIQGNNLIIDEYKLQFQATLGGSSDALSAALFALIKQNSGEFRGDDEGPAVVKRLSEQFDLNQRADVLRFVDELDKKIHTAASGGKADSIGIASILRKDMVARSVYDLLYGLSYLEPRYSLLFQDTKIEQLSPGQRGALLLIFYLLVDRGRNPIILDQPEENLDNETVVSLLVPVLSDAKKKRQIIMVTHNPNLAVVCDAEQVIYSSFNRKGASKIEYVSGAIENPIINKHVVDVLEGTKPAFDNRRIKYH
ncbi:MAG: TrlF family AAA-like ATPase [Sulfuricella sp.]